jgi:hypothetical protein
MRSQASAGAVASAPIAPRGRQSLARKIRSLRRFLVWTWVTILGKRLFTNACGDFTLLSRADWDALRAYPEWPMYSWHLDSMLIYQARYSGMREIYLGKSAPVYHIEHSPGSGFTPESSDKLFERLRARGIPYLDWERDVEPKIEAMKAQQTRGGGAIYFNHNGWGFADQALVEARVGAAHPNRVTA